jgi:hypothetical protein
MGVVSSRRADRVKNVASWRRASCEGSRNGIHAGLLRNQLLLSELHCYVGREIRDLKVTLSNESERYFTDLFISFISSRNASRVCEHFPHPSDIVFF